MKLADPYLAVLRSAHRVPGVLIYLPFFLVVSQHANMS